MANPTYLAAVLLQATRPDYSAMDRKWNAQHAQWNAEWMPRVDAVLKAKQQRDRAAAKEAKERKRLAKALGF